jgi:NAD-dependent deacetylase
MFLTRRNKKTIQVDNTSRPTTVVVLTGAGISAPSGLPTFRNDPDSFWTKHDPDIVCNTNLRHSEKHLEFNKMFKHTLKSVFPNLAHKLISKMQRLYGTSRVKVYTTNIDDLHEQAGTYCVHLHGEIRKIRCESCEWSSDTGLSSDVPEDCPKCGSQVRTNVLLFGEPLGPEYEQILEDIQNLRPSDLFISIGSSFSIFPFDDIIKTSKGRKINITLDSDSELAEKFDTTLVCSVTNCIEELSDEMLKVLQTAL